MDEEKALGRAALDMETAKFIYKNKLQAYNEALQKLSIKDKEEDDNE